MWSAGRPRSRWRCTDDGIKAKVQSHISENPERELLHSMLSSLGLNPATSDFGPLMLQLLGNPGAGWVCPSWPHCNGVSCYAAPGSSPCSANAQSIVSLSLSLALCLSLSRTCSVNAQSIVSLAVSRLSLSLSVSLYRGKGGRRAPPLARTRTCSPWVFFSSPMGFAHGGSAVYRVPRS